MNAVAFEWRAIEDERVNGIYIYKQNMTQEASELSHYKTIDNRFTTHYLDNEIKPDTAYTYSFKTFSKEAESQMSEAKVINSLPVLQSVVWIQSIQNMPRTAKIIWRPHTNQKVKSYIIERRTLEEEKWSKIATVDGRLNAEFIDVDLKDEYVYKYRVLVLTYDGITSTPSEIVQVVTKALPISIKHIVATTNLPRKIEINWEKSTTEDFSFYHLYKSETSDGTYELIAKLYNPTFTDVIEEDGKEYFYRVSAVEKNGLESIHDKISIQGITLIKPEIPSLVEAKVVDNKIEIKWNNKDTRVKKYTVIKKAKTGWFDAKDEEFVDITGKKFLDPEIGPNITYYYQVFAIDEFGIKSEPSIEVEIKTPNTVANNVKKEEPKELSKKTQSKEVEVIVPTQDFN
ncbi:protein containing fibronectin type III domain [Sulfurimonas gotlandica GD1]|uniref:Protein containing fibronectin type III domain n=2 Tax=Sulfurimonas TaxID=202746 RepID=B6BNM6_SULGG|nr:fibronectin, type III [Sulfurimonas gotlandica GD1]EHP28830.1 protein containing fibronectin type III domain [Sulfurimonas gotlandica GD1]